MLPIMLILICAGAFSAICWILEIQKGRDETEELIKFIDGNIVKAIVTLPKIIYSFRSFVLDILITFLFCSIFVVSQSMYAMAVALVMSDVFSVYLLKSHKTKG